MRGTRRRSRSRSGTAGCSRSKDAGSEEELAKRLRAFDAKLPAGVWMLGGSWDHDRALGGRLPTKEMLDAWVRERPVWLRRYDGHMGVGNTRALELAGITAATPDPPGGAIVRRAGSREPTGVLRDGALALMEAHVPPPSDGEIAQAVAAALGELRANGVTAVEDMGGMPLETRRRLLREYQSLALRRADRARAALLANRGAGAVDCAWHIGRLRGRVGADRRRESLC